MKHNFKKTILIFLFLNIVTCLAKSYVVGSWEAIIPHDFLQRIMIIIIELHLLGLSILISKDTSKSN